jgi:hypothetical protein
MGRYTHVFIAQMMHTSACNARHPVPQRCARWLLMTHDRMHEHDFTLSHDDSHSREAGAAHTWQTARRGVFPEWWGCLHYHDAVGRYEHGSGHGDRIRAEEGFDAKHAFITNVTSSSPARSQGHLGRAVIHRSMAKWQPVSVRWSWTG